MIKKLFIGIMAIVALLTVAGTMTSCKPVQGGTVLYSIDMKDFDDNMDILRNAIEKDFESLGLKSAGTAHDYVLEGELNACNKKAAAIFQQCCLAVDKDRSRLALPSLALKGKTIAFMYIYGSNKENELCTYTFVEKDK